MVFKWFLNQLILKMTKQCFLPIAWEGSSVYDIKDDVSASFAADVVNTSGIAGFDQIELDKKLSSKVVRINPYINELEEGLRGSSSQEDFETLLQMIYLYFTNPRVDKTAYSSLMTRYNGLLKTGQQILLQLSGTPYR